MKQIKCFWYIIYISVVILLREKEIRYYHSYEDDFIKTKNQEYKVKDSYKYINNNIFVKIFSFLLYVIFYIIGIIYLKLFLYVKFKNKNILKKHKRFFLYANHTQPVGDAFIPSVLLFPKMPYIIVNSANLGIPFLGKLLPFLGALPIPNEIHKMKEFMDAINTLNKQNKNIIIYPEAHVWEYNTFIREFPTTSFRFPVESNAPVFTMTTTYQKAKHRKKPNITIYFDGPFYPNEGDTKKEKIKLLHDKVYLSLVNNSKNSNYDYIKYIKKD